MPTRPPEDHLAALDAYLQLLHDRPINPNRRRTILRAVNRAMTDTAILAKQQGRVDAIRDAMSVAGPMGN
jgi:hypothetical protein